MKTFAENQERMRKAFGGEQAMANLEALTRSNMQWFEQAMRMFAPLGAGTGESAGADARRARQSGESGGAEAVAPSDKAQASPADLGDNLDQLQRQLREMQEQLDRLSRDRKA